MSDLSEEQFGVGRDTRTEINFKNGSRIICLPVGRDGSNIRGFGADLLIVDEAAFIPDEIFQEVLSPMLAVGDGEFFLLSTPFGKKGFLFDRYQESVKLNDPDSDEWNEGEWVSMRVPTEENPLIPDKFIKEQRENLTRTQFKQEILGIFDESSNAFFTREELESCTRPSVSRTSDVVFLGADIAAGGDDQTVLLSIDADGNVFDIEHYDDFEIPDSIERIEELDGMYNYQKIIVDETGLGKGVVQQISRSIGRKAEGFNFTGTSKPSLYNSLKKALQNEEIVFPHTPGKNTEPGNMLFNECQELERGYTRTDKMKVEHPSGGHDDFADALALAVWAKDQKTLARSDSESMQPFNLGSLK